jgi:hypothetical protein
VKSENDVGPVYDRDVMMIRAQVTLDPEMHRTARKRAAELGISFAEYVRGLVARDIAVPRKKADPSILFALGRSTESDVARDKDRMIAKAFGALRIEKTRPD